MTKTVLFLCPHGAAKSVLAAALFQRLADEQNLSLRTTCAGTDPDPTIAPRVRALLVSQGLPLPLERPQLVTKELLAQAHRVISLGCRVDELPLVPEQWEQWNDVPLPSQDLEGAHQRIGQDLAALVMSLGVYEQPD